MQTKQEIEIIKKRNMTEKILLLFPPCSTLDVKNTMGSYAQNVQFNTGSARFIKYYLVCRVTDFHMGNLKKK